MPDFTARIVTTYRDIAGLALDLSPGQEVDDGSGKAILWRNTAPKRRGAGRVTFGDAAQADATFRPPIDGGGGMAFAGASQQLIAPVLGGAVPEDGDFTIAAEFPSIAPVGTEYFLDSVPGSYKFFAKSSGGFFGYNTVFAGGVLQPGVHLITSSIRDAAVTWLEDNLPALSGAVHVPGITLTGLSIGSRFDGAGTIHGVMRSLRFWDRALCPIERDLAYRTIGPTPQDVLPHATVSLTRWRDETGDGIQQVRRINPRPSAFPNYLRATGSMPIRVQLALLVNGEVLRDSLLGGRLFSTAIEVERPSAAPPVVVYQDTGYSAVQDIELRAAGHYTFIVSRPSGGAKIIHLDVG